MKARGAILALLIFLISQTSVPAQMRNIRGVAVTIDEKGKKTPTEGVVIQAPRPGVGTKTDSLGLFLLRVPDSTKIIVASFIGYTPDTISLKPGINDLSFTLQTPHSLSQVVVQDKLKSTEIGTTGIINSEKIGMGELQKAACCNLSESFTTTPSIDQVFTDAVTGYKQIRLLGLMGQYSLITTENIPDFRGLLAVTGLSFIPGAWIEGIQITKGAGSVVNGFESFAGQINVELKKPFDGETWFFNSYQSTQGHTEVDINYRRKRNKRLATNLMAYANAQWLKLDQNFDHFLDQPLGKQVNILNRWIYTAPNGWMCQAGVKFLYTDGTGGEWNYKAGDPQVAGNPWGYQFTTLRFEDWAKIAKVFEKPGTSIGLQLSNVNYDQDSKYGPREYIGLENSIYANLIFQTYINNSSNIIKLGASAMLDNYQEQFALVNYDRNEKVPGVFAEYTHNFTENFNVMMGLRTDYNNYYGAFATPRLHLRYAPFKRTVIRASLGRAERTANIFAENMGFMVGNRQFDIVNPIAGKPYGLDPEIAWNTGANLVHKFRIGLREAVFTLDYYYTWFQDQVVVDVNTPDFVFFYNLHGRSFASSFSAQLDYELIHNLNIRLAYRYYNVMTSYQGIQLNTYVLEEKPLIPASRAFTNFDYQTRNKWKFDLTVQYISTQRTPGIVHNHGGLIPPKPNYSPSYVQVNCQVTKVLSDMFELYLGGENLTDFMQHDAIVDPSNPYAHDFDASMIWGPMMGRNVYIGARYKIK